MGTTTVSIADLLHFDNRLLGFELVRESAASLASRDRPERDWEFRSVGLLQICQLLHRKLSSCVAGDWRSRRSLHAEGDSADRNQLSHVSVILIYCGRFEGPVPSLQVAGSISALCMLFSSAGRGPD